MARDQVHMDQVHAYLAQSRDVVQKAMDDPEFAGDIHIIFHVPARGGVEEELAREDEWGRRLLQIIPRSPQVYLVFVDYSA